MKIESLNMKERFSAKEFVYFQERETMSMAEASLLKEDFVPGTKGMYFFNRLVSKDIGKGGGTRVLRQLLNYCDNVKVPLLNQVSAYPGGGLSQNKLI